MAAGVSQDSSILKMRVFIKTTSPKLVPLWTQRILFAGGILMLGYCGFVLLDTWIFQRQENAALEHFVPDVPVASGLRYPRPSGRMA